jgi:hypothetical protein
MVLKRPDVAGVPLDSNAFYPGVRTVRPVRDRGPSSSRRKNQKLPRDRQCLLCFMEIDVD